MIKPKSWERVMKVHMIDANTFTVCKNYVFNPKLTNLVREVTCKRCLKLMEETCATTK